MQVNARDKCLFSCTRKRKSLENIVSMYTVQEKKYAMITQEILVVELHFNRPYHYTQIEIVAYGFFMTDISKRAPANLSVTLFFTVGR